MDGFPNASDLCANFVFGRSSLLQLWECAPVGPYLHLLLLSALTVLLFYILALTADEFLCPALVELARALGMSQSLAGVTIVAFGNGAPDVFSALSGIRQNKSSMVFSQLIGSGAFVSALVSGIVMILVPPFTVNWPTFSRDIVFYLTGIIFTFYVFYRNTIHIIHAAAFMAIYALYIAIVGSFSTHWQARDALEADEEAVPEKYTQHGSATSVYDPALELAKVKNSTNLSMEAASSYGTFNGSETSIPDSRSSTDESSSHSVLAELALHTLPWSWEKFRQMPWYSKIRSFLLLPVSFILSLTIPVVNRELHQVNWCKTLNTVHCVLTPVSTVFLFSGNFEVHGVPLSFCVIPFSSVLGLVVFCTSRYDRAPRYHLLFAILGFAASVGWIFWTCEMLVETLSDIGKTLGIPDSVMGLTVLSWGSSLGDLVTNVAIARHGYASMAISAAFGGILLDMLLGLGKHNFSLTFSPIIDGQ